MPSAIDPHGIWLLPHPDGQLWDPKLAIFLAGLFQGKTVIDLGCGLCHYLKAWRQAGVDVDGMDGSPFVADLRLGCYVMDLAEPILFAKSNYDWAFCLEVGEHIPPEHAGTFLDNVAAAAREGIVLSWAVPGQPGHGHVNCRPNEWVIWQLELRGFALDRRLTRFVREIAYLPYLRQTLVVFRL